MTDFRRRYHVGITSVLRRCGIAMLLLWVPVQVAALAPSISTWLQMADICEEVLVAQSTDALNGLQPSETVIVGLDSVDEVAVLSAEGAVTLAVAESGDQLFLCLVESNSDLSNADTRALSAAWVAEFSPRAVQDKYEALAFNAPTQIDPAMLRCLADDRMVVVFAYLGPDEGAFRVAAATSLPSKMGNPCLKGGS